MFEGLIYQFVYNLERHRLLNIRLRPWLILLCLVLPLTTWLRLWGASYLTASLVTVGAVGALVAIWWAGRQHYVRFEEQAHSQASAFPTEGEEGTNEAANQQSTDPPLPAMSKIRVRATGFFEVSGMRRYFVEAPAHYTTFETREHCVMAQIPLSRFLILGKSDQSEAGWWYTFFQPAVIRSVHSGWLYFGLRPHPALRLEIALPDDSKNEILHLSFDDEGTRSLVLADLRHDMALN